MAFPTSKGLASVERHVALLLLERQFFVRARRLHCLPVRALLSLALSYLSLGLQNTEPRVKGCQRLVR